MKLLLRGGISTASSVSEVSGRGIGLDVVREVVERIGGEIAVRSERGTGTSFELVVPVSIASLDVLVVEAGGVITALPIDAVRGTLRIDDADLARTAHARSIIHAGTATPFVSLAGLLRRGESARVRRGSIGVIVEGAGGIAAIGVDRLVGTLSTVVRPIPAVAGADPVIAGASMDAMGNPQLVLDPDRLVEAARTRTLEPARVVERHSVLVIDDSMTTRMLEQSILESAGYDVDTATSGEQGLEAARKKRYALFLVDVEMPGIDGFTFVERVRADPDLRGTPAILVTSRNSAEDRQRGTDVGAQGYIVKSEFDQADLLARIQRMVALP
jgi:two-component system chemotaxis sensor kinase CheA